MEHMYNALKITMLANEEWLMKRILHYAKDLGYTKYTSTLEEAWRISIVGLTDSISKAIDQYNDMPTLGPDEKYEDDPVSQFGLAEARLHRSRGITLSMFLGLLKYYKQSYIDLILDKKEQFSELEKVREFIERCFDRIELAFCREWALKEQEELLGELRESNRQLANEKNSYLTVFESISDPVIIINSKHEIINLNFAAASLLNKDIKPGTHYYSKFNSSYDQLKSSSIIGYKIYDIFPVFYEYFELFDNGEAPKDMVELEAPVDENVLVFEINYAPMLDVSEKFVGSVITLRNITDKKLTETALMLSEEQFRGAFETAAHGIVMADPNGIFFKVNQSFCKMIGFEENEMIGMDFKDITYEDDINKDMEQVRKLVEGKIDYFHIYKRYIHKDNSIVPVHLSVSVVRNYENQPILFVGQVIDITEQIQAEEKLKSMNEELENRVIERTELLESAYKKIEKSLEKEKLYSDLQSRFINTISHEYRTPLTKIYASADLIKTIMRDQNVTDADKYVSNIKKAVDVLIHLLEDVITFNESLKDTIKLTPEPIELIGFIKNTCDEISSLDNGNHNFVIKSDDDPLTIMIDKTKFRLILSHLLINAMKYSPDDLNIDILVHAQNEIVSISVKDYGLGISEDDLQRLFDPFYKSKESIGLKSGIGLGLPVVKKYINAFDGDITVESEFGKGSEFIITLPIL